MKWIYYLDFKGVDEMEKLKVNGYFVEVDYYEELEPFMDRFERVRVRGEKLQACSPFREEKNPSFAVNLENGSWVDSGANEEENRKGSLISLLAYFRGESYEDTADYLLEKYIHILDDADELKLELNLKLNEPEVHVLGAEKYEGVVGKVSDYLLNRGIDAETQKFFETGIGKLGDSVAIPWHDSKGRIINIKYRSINGKEFWYSKDGQPVKKHIYGLFAIKQLGIKEAWAVESEIDALYLWSNGIPAIAFGGASINDIQKSLLLNSDLESLVIATDNDEVGKRFGNVLWEEFAGYMIIRMIKIPNGYKDVNELSREKLEVCQKTKYFKMNKLNFI